jgi:hypothetical protein
MLQLPVRADDARGAPHAAMSQVIDRGASPELLGPPLVAEIDRFGHETGVVEMGPFGEDAPGDGGIRELRRPLPNPPSLRLEQSRAPWKRWRCSVACGLQSEGSRCRPLPVSYWTPYKLLAAEAGMQTGAPWSPPTMRPGRPRHSKGSVTRMAPGVLRQQLIALPAGPSVPSVPTGAERGLGWARSRGWARR